LKDIKERIFLQIGVPTYRHFGRLIVLLLFFFICQAEAQSRPAIVHSPGQERVFEIDKELMATLLEFSRFNVRFQQEANRHQKWRLYLYPLMQETGTALSFSNTLIDIRQRAQGFYNTAEVSKGAQKPGFCLAITGNAIGGTSSVMELAQNTWVMRRASKMGFSPEGTLNYVREKRKKSTSCWKKGNNTRHRNRSKPTAASLRWKADCCIICEISWSLNLESGALSREK